MPDIFSRRLQGSGQFAGTPVKRPSFGREVCVIFVAALSHEHRLRQIPVVLATAMHVQQTMRP